LDTGRKILEFSVKWASQNPPVKLKFDENSSVNSPDEFLDITGSDIKKNNRKVESGIDKSPLIGYYTK
jgi:hypothetical protein